MVEKLVSSYDWGRCCLIISLDWGGILSGKRTENSTIRSPRCDGFLGKGRPSPLSRFAVPGLMMSWHGREMMRFSSVGILTVQPHNAWRGEDGERVKSFGRNEMPKPWMNLSDFMFPWRKPGVYPQASHRNANIVSSVCDECEKQRQKVCDKLFSIKTTGSREQHLKQDQWENMTWQWKSFPVCVCRRVFVCKCASVGGATHYTGD